MTNPHNLLSNETSPYLLQHADNPVDWQPWGEQALRQARETHKPILLSIGYSACHWCHVMAHESFEDDATAKIMNDLFINIKVDREERPDLDRIYQTAHSLLTSRPGGWPLTVFLSPDTQMPFFAGTYFPHSRRYNMPSFTEILHMVADAFQNRQQDIAQQDQSISDVLLNISSHTPTKDTLSTLPLDLARRQLLSAFDHIHGGFSSAPKFPHPDMIERCLRHYLFIRSQHQDDPELLDIATFTLDRMALGGFQDHAGGGFYRYSTDNDWMIPHFEKMLYDNAQLITLYSQAYSLTSKEDYRFAVEHAANWVLREMQTPEGGYCSSLDADTDKVEGKTYVWTPEEVRETLDETEYRLVEHKYGLQQPANFEGRWHLHSTISNSQLASQLGIEPGQAKTQLYTALDKLLSCRNQRPQPGRDDKILCSWNALMIRGMSLAGRRCQRPDFIASAFRSAEFIRLTLWQHGRLLASYKDGKAHLNAYLDDYAYLLQAVLELLQAEWRNDYFNWAIEIANSLITHFEDSDHGGFYFTSHDHEQLLYRSKTFADDAMPNGNAIAAYALFQLGLLCADTRYLDAAENTLRCGYKEINEHPISHCSMLHALELYLNGGRVIILRGTPDQLKDWKQVVDGRYLPDLYCVAIPAHVELTNSLSDKKSIGPICAYICEGTHCLQPVTSLDDFIAYLDGITCYDHD